MKKHFKARRNGPIAPQVMVQLPGGYPIDVSPSFYKIGASNPRVMQFDLVGGQYLMQLWKQRYKFENWHSGGENAGFYTIKIPTGQSSGRERLAQYVVTRVVGYQFAYANGDDHDIHRQAALTYADNIKYDPSDPLIAMIDIVCAASYRDKNGDDFCWLAVDVEAAFYGPMLADKRKEIIGE